MKNYIGFVNDHSGSMQHIARAAMADYNTNIAAVKDAATREMLDTVVSVVGVGYPNGTLVTRQVTVSNPHVLKPITSWSTDGGTPLYDGIGNMIELLDSLPDANDPNVSFLIMVTTDGEEEHSRKYNAATLGNLIRSRQAKGNWTFVFRVPKHGHIQNIIGLGVPMDNIQQWDTTTAGLQASTQVTTQAMDSYFTLRASGAKSTGSFYTNAAAVNLAVLEDISSKVSLYVVPEADNGIEIRPFMLRHRSKYLKGAAFYQLTKTEAKVGPSKLIAVRERVTGKIYSGKDARTMIGLPNDPTKNARLHPGDHKNYDIFIQSESINRKLVGGTGVLYWREIGKPFTDADLAYLQPKPMIPVGTFPVALPAVPVSTKPTKSPIPVTKRVPEFDTREEARIYCGANNIRQSKITKGTHKKWAVLTA